MPTSKKQAKKTTPTTTQAPEAPKAPAPTSTTSATPKGQNLFNADGLKYRQATLEEIEKASSSRGTRDHGMRGQIADAIKDLDLNKGIVITEEFRRVRRMVSAINRNGEVPNKKFFTREFNGEVFVIRES